MFILNNSQKAEMVLIYLDYIRWIANVIGTYKIQKLY